MIMQDITGISVWVCSIILLIVILDESNVAVLSRYSE